MKICITPSSLKLFGTYINRQLANQLQENKNPQRLISDLFELGVETFSDTGLTEVENKEIVLQHMSIVPQIVLKHLAENPTIQYKQESVIKNLASEVIQASTDKSAESFERIVNRFGELVGNKNTLIPGKEFATRFKGISIELFKTNNQEAIWTEEKGYSENIQNPAKVFEFNVSRNLIRTNNRDLLKFELTTLGNLKAMDDFVDTINSKDLNTIMLVLVNSKGEVVKFNESGNIDSKGKIPGYSIQLNRPSLEYQTEVIAQIYERKGLTKRKAFLQAQSDINDFADYIKQQSKSTEKVYLNVNVKDSSLGFVATDRNNITPLSEVANLNTPDVSLEQQSNIDKSFYPILKLKNTNRTYRVFQNSTDTFTEDEFKILHYLLTADKVMFDNFKQPLTNTSRVKFIGYYLQSIPNVFEYIPGKKANKVTEAVEASVILGTEIILAKNLTIDKLKEWANTKHSLEISKEKVGNSKILDSVDDVTHRGQVYKGQDGKLYERTGLERTFANARNLNMDDLILGGSRLPVKLNENGVIETGNAKTLREQVTQHGYTNVVLNASNELVAMGSYLKFEKSLEDIDTLEEFGVEEIKFKSISKRNQNIEATTKQNEAALAWFKQSPLADIIKLNFIDGVSEMGPNFIASFIGNAINLYNGATPSEIYHEAFHAFFDGILTESERNEIYQSLKSRSGVFNTTVRGEAKTIRWSEASNLELEEFLAESFREFALSDGKKISFSNNKVKAFFQKLLELLKNILGNMTYAEAKALNKSNGLVDVLFNSLYKGEFTSDMFMARDEQAKWKSEEIKTITGDVFSLEEMSLIMESMQSLMAEFINKGLNISRDKSVQQKALTYLKVMSLAKKGSVEYNKAAAAYKQIQKTGPRNGTGIYQLQNNPVLLNVAIDFIKARLQQELNFINERIKNLDSVSGKSIALDYQKQLLEKTLNIENFGSIKSFEEIVDYKDVQQKAVNLLKVMSLNTKDSEAYKEAEKAYSDINTSLLGAYLNNYSSLNLANYLKYPEQFKALQDAEDVTEDSYEIWFGRLGNEIMLADTVSEQTKEILSSVRQYDNQGKGDPVLNVLGIQKVIPFTQALAKVARLLRNQNDAMVMSRILKDAAQDDMEIAQVFERLGDISTIELSEEASDFEQKQWTSFWQSLNKPEVLLKEFIAENEIEIFDPLTNLKKQSSATLTTKIGKSQSDSLRVDRVWNAQFKFNLLSKANVYVGDELDSKKTDKSTIPVLRIDEILEEYLNPEERFFRKISGPGPMLITSKSEIQEGAVYSTQAQMRAYADPIEFLSLFGITMTDELQIRESLQKGNASIGYEQKYLGYVIDLLKNRLNATVYDSVSGSTPMPGRNYITKLSDLFKGFTYAEGNEYLKQEGLGKVRTKLRDLEYAYSNEYTNFSSRNAKGDLQSERSFNSSLLMNAKAINDAQSIDELISTPGMEHYNPTVNPQVMASLWLVNMFQLDNVNPAIRGKRDNQIKITVDNLSGNKFISKLTYTEQNEDESEVLKFQEFDKGISALASDINTKFISDFYLTLDGSQEIMRSEAKNTSLSVHAPFKNKQGLRAGNTLPFDVAEISMLISDNYQGTALFHLFKGHIFNDIIRRNRTRKLKQLIKNGKINTADLAIDVKQLNKGDDLFMFADILSPKTISKIDNQLGTDFTETTYGKGDIFTLDVQKLIESDLRKALLEDADFLQNTEGWGKKLPISDPIYNKYKTRDGETKADVLRKMFIAFTVNNFLSNANYSATFLGDVSVYDIKGEKFHKRVAGFISTGKVFRADAAWLKYVNSSSFNNNAFAKKHNELKDNTRKDFSYNGNLQTAVMAEAVSNSVFRKQYADLLKLNPEDYEGMEEADGQGYISFDTYRMLNWSLDEWSDSQENLYQKMLRGESLTFEDMKTTFPVRKFQFYGTVFNEKSKEILLEAGVDFTATAFHKFSLMPLVPELIKNSPALVALHESMMEQGLDYVTMESGSKLSTLTKVEYKDGQFNSLKDEFYDAATRKVSPLKWTKNTINVINFKSQILLKEGYKGYVTLPTQLRKIALNGILDNGVPFDFLTNELPAQRKAKWEAISSDLERRRRSKKWSWYQEYVSTLKSMENLLKNELLEDVALKEETITDKQGKPVKIYTGDSKRLVAYITEQLSNKDILPEEISYITNPDGTLKGDLSFSLIGTKIEELLVTLVDKKLRRLKTNGEKLTQVSSAMWESQNWKTGTKEDHEKYGTSGLKFHYLKDNKGNIVLDKKTKNFIVTEMEIKISLQGDFKKLLYTQHTDGNQIAVYKKDESGKKILQYNESLSRLNESIKDKVWLNQYGKLIDIPGVRIPSQGSNAFIATRVAEFLPEFAGPIIIMPSEVVVNTGSDYDVDAMFTLFKNILSKYGKTEQIEYKPGEKRTDSDLYNLIENNTTIKTKLLEEKQIAWNDYIKYLSEKQELNESVQSLIEANNQLDKSIDKLYDQRNEIKNYTTYSESQKRILFDLFSKDINDLENLQTINAYEIDKLVNDFFNTVIYDKADRKEAVKREYDKYMGVINNIEKEIKEVNNKLFELEKAIQGKTIKGLQNRLSDLIQERILDPANIANLVRANTTEAFEQDARDAGKLVEQRKAYNKYGKQKGNDRSVSNNSIFKYRYNLMQHQQMSVALDSLGIAAIASTFYAVFTTFQATLQGNSLEATAAFEKALEYLSNSQNAQTNPARWADAIKTIDKYKSKILKLDSNIIETVGENQTSAITLGLVRNVDNQLISDLLSQLINGYVDAANDPFIAEMQGSKENTPTILFLTMAGVRPSDIISIMTNSAVLDYNKYLAEFGGIFGDIIESDNEEALKKLEGKFYDEDFKNTRESRAQAKALDAVIKDNEEILAKEKISSVNFNRILNTSKPFKSSELKKRRASKSINFRDMEILAQFLAAKDMAESLNDFIMLQKFDTEKVTSISEAQDRQEKIKTFKNIPLEEKFIPNSWFDKIKESPIGAFNNDQFIVDLFAKYYGVKNNPALILKSLGIKVPRGMDRSKVLSDFKDEFVWFMYQNAVYNSKSYVTSASKIEDNKTTEPGIIYKLIEDNSLTTIEINKETGEVKYPKNIFDLDFNKNSEFQEFNAVVKFFRPNKPLDYVKFIIELRNLQEVSFNMTQEEFLNRYGVFDFQNTSLLKRPGGKNLILQKVALYNTMNQNAMFDSSTSVVNVLQNIHAKYKAELDNYAFFRDYRPDYSEALAKMNIYFPEIKNAQMARVYRENIIELKNSPHEEVRDFFGKLDHIALMQTGLLATSKYAITKITAQNLLENVIESEIGLAYIQQVLDEVNDQVNKRVKRKEIDGQIIDQFLQLFQASINNGAQKVRGYDYTVEELQFGKIKKAKLKAGKSIITLINSADAAIPSLTSLTVDDFYNSPGDTPTAIASLLLASGKEFQIFNQKFIAPVDQSQALLDKALLMLGINNKGPLPKIQAKMKTNIGEGLSIQNSETLKGSFFLKDEAMANRANKVIAKATPAFVESYASSTQGYINVLKTGVYENKNVVLESGVRKKQFNSKDSVWIFGSGIFANAYKGRQQSEWVAAVQETFNTHHKKLIDKALREGVVTFIVGNASGIDTFAREYLESKGFVSIMQYTNDGIFYEMVPGEKLDSIITELYTPSLAEVYLDQEIGSTKKLIADVRMKVRDLSKEEYRELTYSSLESIVMQTIQELDNNSSGKRGYSFRAEFSLDLIKTGRSQLVFDMSPTNDINTLLSKIMMEIRRDIQKTREVKEVLVEVNADIAVKNYNDIFTYGFIDVSQKESVLKRFTEKWKGTLENPLEYINEKLSSSDVSSAFIIEQLKEC